MDSSHCMKKFALRCLLVTMDLAPRQLNDMKGLMKSSG